MSSKKADCDPLVNSSKRPAVTIKDEPLDYDEENTLVEKVHIFDEESVAKKMRLEENSIKNRKVRTLAEENKISARKIPDEQNDDYPINEFDELADLTDKFSKDSDYMFCKIGYCNNERYSRKKIKHHFKHIHKTEVPSKPLICLANYCGEAFAVNQKKALLDHIWSRHLADGRLVFRNNPFKYINHQRYIVFVKQMLSNILTNDKYYCKICDTFVEAADLEQHLSETHSTDKYECPELNCQLKFEIDGKVKLTNHMKDVHLLYKWGCRICTEPFEFIKDRSNHEKIVHGEEAAEYLETKRKVELEVCVLHKKFIDKFGLGDTFLCKICNINVMLSDIQYHYTRVHVHMDLSIPIECPIFDCKEFFSIKDFPDLPKHLRVVHFGNTLKCRVCDDAFENNDQRRGHEKWKHKEFLEELRRPIKDENGSESRKTSFSEEGENTVEDLEELADTADKIIRDQDFYCKLDNCKMERLQLKKVRQHFKVTHNIETPTKPLICMAKNCDMSFGVTHKKKMIDHVWSFHLGDGRLVFKKNVSKYINHSRYILHMRQISFLLIENDIFYCKFCDDYYDADDLKQHVSDIHSMELFECPALNCDLKFDIDCKTKLINHFKDIHLMFKWGCRICTEPFEFVKDRSAHEKNVHGQEASEYLEMKRKVELKVASLHKKYIEDFNLGDTYYCKMCNVTENLSDIQGHYMRVHVQMDLSIPIECPILDCTQVFTIKELPDLPKHIRVEHLGYDVKCRICDDVFENLELRRGHERTKHKDEAAVIDNEERNQKNVEKEEQTCFKEIMKYHKRYYRTKPINDVLCKLCEQTIPLDHFASHSETYHNYLDEQSLICPIDDCNLVFWYTDKVKLPGHIKLAHLHYYTKCRKCDEVFDTIKNRDTHEFRKHDTNEIIMAVERECNTSFYNSVFKDCRDRNDPNFLNIFLEVSSKRNVFFCTRCLPDWCLIWEEKIDEHFARNHPNLIVKLPCPAENCQAIFDKGLSHLLRSHVYKKHLDFKMKCRLCEFVYPTVFLRSKHEKEVHQLRDVDIPTIPHNKEPQLKMTKVSIKVVPKDAIMPPAKKTKVTKETIEQTIVPTFNKKVKLARVSDRIMTNEEPLKFLNDFVLGNAVDNLYYCKHCPGFEISGESFLDHFQIIHNMDPPNEPLECPVKECEVKFPLTDKNALTTHVKTVHLKFNDCCRFCPKVFQNSDEIAIHEKKIHGIINEFAQNPKPLTIISTFCIQNDMILCFKMIAKKKLEDEDFACKLCGGQSVKWSDLYLHYRSQHQIKDLDEVMACPIENCPAVFRNEAKYKIPLHMKIRHLGFNFICELCDEVFDTEYSRDRHENEKHDHFKLINSYEKNKAALAIKNELAFLTGLAKTLTENYAFFCTICKQTRIIHNPAAYYQRHHNLKMPKFPQLCPVKDCCAKFKADQSVNFSNHIKIIHLGYKKKCNYCEIIFKTSEQLKKHELDNHQGTFRPPQPKEYARKKTATTSQYIVPESFIDEEYDHEPESYQEPSTDMLQTTIKTECDDWPSSSTSRPIEEVRPVIMNHSIMTNVANFDISDATSFIKEEIDIDDDFIVD